MAKARKAVVFDPAAPELDSGGLEDFVRAVRKAAGLRGEVSVLITSDLMIRRLNSRFRGKHSATDVLSFPAAESNGFTGDIAISLDIASRNARRLGHSVTEEIRILILHGILHLAGYDHEDDQGEMEEKETELREKFGLSTGLIERSVAQENSSSVAGRPAIRRRAATNSGTRRTAHNPRRSRT
ncbi:MAG TPA: rRNA maturation RNase YbeY [Terriglobales bacterium]|nr:rRNA maturation RNase YbeY [Terriglobales bacterium]